MNLRTSLVVFGLLAGISFACSGGAVSTEEQARKAYLGLDKSVAKSMKLGFDGFNSASSANISPQSVAGEKSGTLTVTGQVDQGSSPSNKGMRLLVGMAGYSDGDVVLDGGSTTAITYSTADGGEPKLDLALRSMPDGTFSGTLVGDFQMSGGLTGAVKLDLALAGDIMDGGSGTTIRQEGATNVTGTATSGGNVFNVNLKI